MSLFPGPTVPGFLATFAGSRDSEHSVDTRPAEGHSLEDRDITRTSIKTNIEASAAYSGLWFVAPLT